MFQGQHLRCERKSVELFRNLTFTLKPGQWLQVEGPNGSGKSSFLRVLLGLLPSQGGKVFWEGRDIRFPDSTFLSQVKYLGHRTGIQERLTPRENLKGWINIQKPGSSASMRMRGLKKTGFLSIESSIESALAQWNLCEVRDIPCEQLSQGQCQRLALARLSLLPARLWVLDEPCAALDNQGIQLLQKILEDHLERSGMLVMVSHTALTLSGSGQNLILGIKEPC